MPCPFVSRQYGEIADFEQQMRALDDAKRILTVAKQIQHIHHVVIMVTYDVC